MFSVMFSDVVLIGEKLTRFIVNFLFTVSCMRRVPYIIHLSFRSRSLLCYRGAGKKW